MAVEDKMPKSWAAALMVVVASCASQQARVGTAFSQRIDCPNVSDVIHVDESRYEVRGCRRVATYDCLGSNCVLWSVAPDAPTVDARPQKNT
jgi:hypothetical protein